jgi:DNA-binding transcriptional LysR family regulator
LAITVTQLTSFVAVVRAGSVSAAADELIVTQPSVSAAVTALGRELGCELFERAGRGVRLTAAGAAFAPYAADVLGLLDQGRQAASEAAASKARTLRIAAVTTAAESFVPPLMHAFATEHAGVELSLDVGNRQQVLERVLDHRADVALTGRPPADDRLVFSPLMDNEIVCICAPDDPLADGRQVASVDLADRPWLLRESGSGTRALNNEHLADHGMRPETLTLGSNGAIKQAARAGLGVSLLPRAAGDVDLASGVLGEIRLRNPPPARPWFVLRSGVGPVRPTVEAFVDYVLAAAGPDCTLADVTDRGGGRRAAHSLAHR